MIRTIAQETQAASYVASSTTSLSLPDGPSVSLLPLTVTGNGSGLDVTAAPGSLSALLTQGEVTPGSVWPLHGVDSFTEFTNDTGSVTLPQDFNALVASVLALEHWTLRVARASPGDLAQRLTTEGRRIL